MIEWTETARRTLDDYCVRTRAVLAGTGADGDEVVDDLRRHVEQEVSAAKLQVVTENDIRRILARFGEPGAAVEKEAEASRPRAAVKEWEAWYWKRPGFVLLFLGVILPLGTFIFEWLTGTSAGVLFDPLPGWPQMIAVALVPAANFWIWWAARSRDARPARLLGWLNGIAMGVSLFYALLYLAFTPIALFAVIYLGLGLIPLAPLLAVVATPWLRAAYRQRIGDKVKLPSAGRGIIVGLGFLVLLQVPVALTHYGLAQAGSEDAAARRHGVRVLRTFGDRDLMLRACYGLLRREGDFDLVRWAGSGNQDVSANHARDIYYRVTGKPFNSVPPPSLYTRMGRWNLLDEEFSWDAGLGGEEVAGRVKGLSLLSSRMDAVAEPDAALVYCEWTLEFKNVSRQPREARAQIALPPGAVVSRLTLWVNGEEREAAFGGRSQTRQAYQEVAVVRRRDPVLVTTCGPDRVLVQCFPVPADGGVMKVRVGISAPLILESMELGRFIWPRFLERNFGIAADFKHSLWIESAAPLSGDTNALVSAKNKTHPFALRETVPDVQLGERSQTTAVHRPDKVESVWSPAGDSGQIIRQTIRPATLGPPTRLVVVVDGSAGMRTAVPEITAALRDVPDTTEIAVILAGDEPLILNGRPQKATPENLSEMERSLAQQRFVGGQDNLPALELAWDLAATAENGAVVWVHQPQPALLSSESIFRQAIERTSSSTRLYELQTVNGPDRIMEKLDGLSVVKHVPRFGALRSDLGELLAKWAGKRPPLELVRERIPAPPDSAVGPRASKHLERLWARDESLRLTAQRNREAAMKLAASYQLVTPLTGAVVLETQQQFSQHGLTPADPTTVPAVPEPGTFSLLGVGMGALLYLRFMRRKRNSKR